VIKTDVAFSADDIVEISGCLVTMAAAERKRSGEGGQALTKLYMKLADDLAGQWLALDEGRKPERVEMPENALTDVDQGVLEEALRRLDQMQLHQEQLLPGDKPWRFVIGLLRGHIFAELAMRGEESN
jgi:hypothetical protein